MHTLSVDFDGRTIVQAGGEGAPVHPPWSYEAPHPPGGRRVGNVVSRGPHQQSETRICTKEIETMKL